MAEVTVEKLASIVGAPTERLIGQMQEAGLTQSAAADPVSDEEKQILLAFLKRSHGGSEGAPKKITLNRKITTQLKSSTSQGRGAKTVNVEVRKKRTYVKRSALDAEQSAERLEAEEERLEVEAKVAEEEAARIAAEEEAKRAEEEAKAKQEGADKAQPSAAITVASVDDIPKDKSPKKKAAKGGEVVDQVETAESEAEAALRLEKEEREARKANEKKLKKAAKPKSPKQWIKEVDEEFEEEGRTKASRRISSEIKVAKPTKFLQKHKFSKPVEAVKKQVVIPESIAINELAQRLSVKAKVLMKTLMQMGVIEDINQPLDQDTAILVVEEMGREYRLESATDFEDGILGTINYEGEAVSRPPVVTVMGHVDHGKTSLLDFIRETRVTEGESGGITQHIGAYQVQTKKGVICFIDTPGHAAFTAMRARGAQATDIVILVVASDDGVMPQTEEAIQHARSAGVPIVVAMNKIDKEGADPERVKNELAAKEVIPEDWGGDVQFIPVSAITGQGIDELLDSVLLQAELLELKAAVDVPATGTVVEARLDKGRGAVATLLVRNGTLKQGDSILAGEVYGRVRALMDDNGKPVKNAGPAMPVEILGLAGTPNAGDNFTVVKNERQAREIAELRGSRSKAAAHAQQQASQLENLFENMGEDEPKILNIVLKTDVRGTLEALSNALMNIGNEEVKVVLVSSGVGGISETDANLAVSTGAVIIGFNVRADSAARKVIEKNGIDLRYYSVVYDIVDHVKSALSGMLSPEFKETIVGVAEVRDIFNSPKFGLIAGSMVIEGTVYRNKPIRVLRDDIVIYEGELESLRRFKDDAGEVRNGMECGIGVKNYTDVKVGDKIEVFEMEQVERSL